MDVKQAFETIKIQLLFFAFLAITMVLGNWVIIAVNWGRSITTAAA